MDKIIIITKQGVIKKLNPDTIRDMGRTGQGVMGIRLKDNDEVVAMTTVREDK